MRTEHLVTLTCLALLFCLAKGQGFRSQCNNRPVNNCGDLHDLVSGQVTAISACTYRYSVLATTTVTFSTCVSDYDTYLCLMDSGYNTLSSNDDYTPVGQSQCNSRSSQITRVLQPGVYYITVSGFGNNYGNYTLSAQTVSDTLLPSRAQCNSRPTHYCGELRDAVSGHTTVNSGCTYTYSVPTLATVTFSTCVSDYDTFLCLQDSSYTNLASNDDYSRLQCNSRSSQITRVMSPGVYYVTVSGFGVDYGNYTLSAQVVPAATPTPQPSLSPAVGCNGKPTTYCGELGVGSISGRLAANTGCTFTYRLYYPDTITFSTCGSAFDTYICLTDANDNNIASNDDAYGCTSNPRTSQITQYLQSGVYHITVTGYGSDHGVYVLSAQQGYNPTPYPQYPPYHSSWITSPFALVLLIGRAVGLVAILFALVALVVSKRRAQQPLPQLQ